MNLRIYLFPLLLSIFLSARLSAQANPELKTVFQEHYAKFVNKGNVFVDAGPNYSIERTPDRHFILKTYYFETGRQTSQYSYADSLLRRLDGKAAEWYDDGHLWSEGEYSDGTKTGFWKEDGREYGMQMAYGEYKNGKKDGPWSAFDSLKNKCELRYSDGEPIGEPTFTQKDGTVDSARFEMYVKRKGGDADFMDKPPSFPCKKKFFDFGVKCGEKSLLDFLGSSINYPEKPRQLEIEGLAWLEFVVDKEGAVTDVIVLRGICDDIRKECLRVVKKMPKWNPGMVNDEPVKVRFRLPVRFQLE